MVVPKAVYTHIKFVEERCSVLRSRTSPVKTVCSCLAKVKDTMFKMRLYRLCFALIQCSETVLTRTQLSHLSLGRNHIIPAKRRTTTFLFLDVVECFSNGGKNWCVLLDAPRMNTWSCEESMHLCGVTVTHYAMNIHTEVCIHACLYAHLCTNMHVRILVYAACLYDGLVGRGTCLFSFLLRYFHVVF